MVYESVARGKGCGSVDENLVPLRERRVRGDRNALAFVAFRDELEEYGCFRLVAAHIANVV